MRSLMMRRVLMLQLRLLHRMMLLLLWLQRLGRCRWSHILSRLLLHDRSLLRRRWHDRSQLLLMRRMLRMARRLGRTRRRLPRMLLQMWHDHHLLRRWMLWLVLNARLPRRRGLLLLHWLRCGGGYVSSNSNRLMMITVTRKRMV